MVTHPAKLLSSIRAGAVIAAVLAGTPWPTHAADPPGSQPAAGDPACFFRRDWKGRWKTAPDSRSMYIEVSRRIYRLDLDMAHPLLKSHWAVVTSRDAGNAICSPGDLRLVVSDQIGTREDLIVRQLTLLTSAEAAALPAELKP